MTVHMTRPVAVGSRVINGTSFGVLYIDDSGNLAQDATHFYWDPTNNRLGIGKTNPDGPIDMLATASGATLAALIKNTASDGATSWRALNDSNHSLELGVGGSGRSDILQSSGYTYSSNGGTSWVNAGTGTFRWAIGGVSTANVFMSLDSTASLTVGLAGTITGSLKLSGSTSGTVTMKSQNTAGTWTLNLPAAAGNDGDVLTWNSGVTTWAAGGGGGGMSIGGAVTSGTAGSVLFVGSGPVLSQDNSNFFWDNTNKALGIGKNSSLSAAVPLDILKSASSATVYGNVKNSDSTGAAGFRGTNDADHFVEYGMGGTGRSDAFDDAGYFYSSAGGIKFATGSVHGFEWLVNGTTSVKMYLNSSGQLGVGTSPNTILSLFESNSGGTTSATVRNDSNSGASSWKALNNSNNSIEMGMGGSSRGDGLQDKGFLFSANGIRLFTTSSTPFDVCINGISDSDRAFAVDGSKNVTIGDAALSTSATDGFLYVPTCAGSPSGTPTSKTGRSPIVIDTSNGRFYAYYGGAWHFVALT